MAEPKYIATSELCERYRRSSRTIARWPSTRGFPKPAFQSVGAENLWLLADVERWESKNMASTLAKAS